MHEPGQMGRSGLTSHPGWRGCLGETHLFRKEIGHGLAAYKGWVGPACMTGRPGCLGKTSKSRKGNGGMGWLCREWADGLRMPACSVATSLRRHRYGRGRPLQSSAHASYGRAPWCLCTATPASYSRSFEKPSLRCVSCPDAWALPGFHDHCPCHLHWAVCCRQSSVITSFTLCRYGSLAQLEL